MAIAKWQGNNLSSASPFIDEGDGTSYAFAKIFVLLAKLPLLIFLLGLLIFSCLVWIWVTGFRSGWEFFAWVYPSENSFQEGNDDAETQKGNDDKVTVLRAVYGFLILISSPFALFVKWSEDFLKDNLIPNFAFPSLIEDIMPVIKKQLGLDNISK